MANFKEFESRSINGGIQYRNFYPNGFGVSIVQHAFSYGHEDGLWELAVFIGDKENHRICYETPITNDVLGRLTEEKVNEVVADIEKLTMDDLIPQEEEEED